MHRSKAHIRWLPKFHLSKTTVLQARDVKATRCRHAPPASTWTAVCSALSSRTLMKPCDLMISAIRVQVWSLTRRKDSDETCSAGRGTSAALAGLVSSAGWSMSAPHAPSVKQAVLKECSTLEKEALVRLSRIEAGVRRPPVCLVRLLGPRWLSSTPVCRSRGLLCAIAGGLASTLLNQLYLRRRRRHVDVDVNVNVNVNVNVCRSPPIANESPWPRPRRTISG